MPTDPGAQRPGTLTPSPTIASGGPLVAQSDTRVQARGADGPSLVTSAAHVVGDLGEDALVERILGRLGGPPPGELWGGDDAAVLQCPPAALLFTTDVLVEGLDFSWEWCSGGDVGWKAVAVNASDIAAMGGRPSRALVTLALPATTPVAVVDAVTEGLVEAASAFGVGLAGGDVSGATELSLGVAMLGAVGRVGPVTRSGSRVGDAICVTGHLGGAAGGLVALQRGLVLRESAPALSRLAARQLRPRARTEAGPLLAAAGATSMIDVSDGLLLDLRRLMRSAARGCFVDPGLVPLDPDLEALEEVLGTNDTAVSLGLTGGEDFELLFTIEEARVGAARDSLATVPVHLTRIGRVTAEGLRVGDEDIEKLEELGWEHLRTP
jgi:thiamine-monophosphate kinase